MSALKSANLVLAFLLELAALAAFADWGLGSSPETVVRVLLGVGTPVLAAVLWGIFAAPRSGRRLRGLAYLAFKLVFFGAAALALVASGRTAIAAGFAGLALINIVLEKVWHQEDAAA